MLPRQYSLSSATFPCMSHVCVSILSSTPSLAAVKAAMEDAIRCHPLLRARVIGNGEPNKRIDLFNMVRDLETKEPNPETFCVVDDNETVDIDEQNMLRVINVANEKELESSWKDSFQYLLDNGPFAKDLLWSMQIHTVDDDTVDRKGNEGSPCALLFVFNHAISDQSSANLLLDHMLTHIENADNIIPAATVVRDIPPSIEESILGKDNLFKQSQFKGGIISSKVLSYVAGKAAEGIKNPVILPDDFTTNNNNNDKSNAVLNAITTITGKAAGGETAMTTDTDSANTVISAPGAGGRSSTVSFRTLSKDDTTNLLAACRANKVSISNVLTAAAAITASNFVGNSEDSINERNYKVLQSLDMRRFHSADTCETPSCHAGSMDLMLGPLVDNDTTSSTSSSKLWELAKDSNTQTRAFMESNGPQNAVRVFDFAMQISE